MIFMLGGMMIGAALTRVVVARWLPPHGEGIDAGQLVASGVGGALGGMLGYAVWSLVARLLTGRRRG